MRLDRIAVVVAVLALSACAPTPTLEHVPTEIASPSPTSRQTPEPASLRVVDGGPAEGAMGTTTVGDDGRPLTYTVVAGDTPDQIRARFDIWWDQLADSEGNRLDRVPTIYPGDVLTFTGSLVAFEEEPA